MEVSRERGSRGVYEKTKLKHKKNELKFSCSFILWSHGVFIAVHGLSLVVGSGVYSLLWCMGFSLSWLLLMQNTDPRVYGLQ